MKNIFISNLSFNVTKEDLQKTFEAYGEVYSAKVITDRTTGRSRGFGFVEMPDDAAATQAIEELNGIDMDGNAISVSEARPRAPRESRDFSHDRQRDYRDRPRNKSFGNRSSDGRRGGGYNRNSY